MSRRARAPGLVSLGVVGLTGAASGFLLYCWSGTPSYVRPTLPVAREAYAAVSAAAGSLRVNPRNPRYFTDGSGRAVLLTGAHTSSNFQDNGIGDPPPVFNYADFDPDTLTGATAMGTVVRGGESRRLASPVADDAVLYLRSIKGGRRASGRSRR